MTIVKRGRSLRGSINCRC